MEDRIDKLPETKKDFIFSPQTTDAIRALVESQNLGPNYGLAVAKLTFLVVMGDVPQAQIQPLLEKVGVAAGPASAITEGLTQILTPVMVRPVAPPTMNEVPPLTTSAPSRTILDLRKPNP